MIAVLFSPSIETAFIKTNYFFFFTQPPAYEDGTDRVFRNVGTQN